MTPALNGPLLDRSVVMATGWVLRSPTLVPRTSPFMASRSGYGRLSKCELPRELQRRLRSLE